MQGQSEYGLGKRLLAAVAVPALGLAVYFAAVRPAELRWGATAEEVARAMPGDELMQHASFWATRAITIHAKPEAIWPWLVQMGYGRAGFYGYDLIENVGSTTGIRSGERIEPALQHAKTGDRLPLSAVAHLQFGEIAQNRYLIWRSDTEPADGVFTWALDPQGDGTTRLVSRVRLRYHWEHAWLLTLDLFTEFADHVAVPEILRGVRDRVEGRPEKPLGVEAVEILIWLAVLAEAVAALICIFRWRAWWRAWATACACAAVLLIVLYAQAPVWVGVGLVSIAAVVLSRADGRRSQRSSAA
ncbi:MAG: hypothetical protein WCC27_22000 [Acidobacteriaceae bacterium]